MADPNHKPNQFSLLRQRRFAPFFWTQFLGAANDNIYKNALIIFVAYQAAAHAAFDANTLVNLVEITPGAPVLGDHVSVRFRGRYPFDCGSLAEKYIAEPESLRLRLTLADTPGCGDTTRVWDTTFDLGVPSAGDHTGLLQIHVLSLGLDRLQGFGFHVTDSNAPPPPPPIDSLKAGLSASAPNPFSERTTFAVSLADPTLAEVAVFDLGGRRVTTIHRGLLPRGTSNLAWDGRRQDGSRAAGGIYFYRLTLPGRVVTRRVVLLGAP